MTTRTLRRDVAIEGVGIHSGAPCRATLRPRGAGHGIAFTRGRAVVPATWRHADAEASDRRTVIVGDGGERFEQIEHLMAALYAAGISDALVEQAGPEVPFLGGGALEFLNAIREAGTEDTGAPRPVLAIGAAETVEDGNALMVATAHDGLRLSCFVEFPGTIVGNMGFSMEVDEESFLREAAPARTFALASDLEKLRAAGLIRGGNLQNAVVFDHERYYNESLAFPDEVVRHKIVDLLGDLALIPAVLRGHFWAWRAGHRGHVKFAQRLAATWQEQG